jgi:hypothetical protein
MRPCHNILGTSLPKILITKKSVCSGSHQFLYLQNYLFVMNKYGE